MWIIDPTSQTETRVNIIEIMNEDTEERITVATKDADKILNLIGETDDYSIKTEKREERIHSTR